MLMVVLITINLLGLIPYLSSSMSILGAIVGVVVWSGFVMFAISSDIILWIAQFLPEGASIILLPPIALIEVVSFVIRPLALVVRICVNLFCGHILLVISGFISLLLLLVAVILLEFSVALVQSYVYSIILIL